MVAIAFQNVTQTVSQIPLVVQVVVEVVLVVLAVLQANVIATILIVHQERVTPQEPRKIPALLQVGLGVPTLQTKE